MNEIRRYDVIGYDAEGYCRTISGNHSDRAKAIAICRALPQAAFVNVDRLAMSIYENQNDPKSAAFNPVQWSK